MTEKKQHVQKVSAQEFIEKLKAASTWRVEWSQEEDRLILQVDDKPEIYISPDMFDLDDMDFINFMRELKELGVKEA